MKTRVLTICLTLLMTMLTQITWASNTITYTTSDGQKINIWNESNITSHTYENGIGTITFANEITSIGFYQFAMIENLTSIVIPEGVTSIEDGAFNGCGLTSLTIPEGVTSIGDDAFSNCFSLTSIVIPSTVTKIGGYVFYGCTFTKDSFVNNSTCTNSGNWGAMIVDEITADGLCILDHIAIKHTGNGSSVTIPEGVTGIGKEAFYYCRSLTSIVIPSTVTSIGEGAFRGCSFMKENFVNNSNCRDHNYWGAEVKQITSDGLTIRNDAVTQYTGNGGSVIIPEGVYAIDSRVFSWKGLTSVVIPSTVTSIGEDAFYGCTFLKENFVNNSNYTYDYPWGATIADEITADGLVISNNIVVDYVGNDGVSVTIPEGIVGIGEDAFYSRELTSVVIPSTVTSIDSWAFGECSISCMYVGENPPTVTRTTFYWMNTSSCILYVPAGCADAYRNDDYWKYFTNIQEESYDINHDGHVDKADVDILIEFILKQEEKK